MVEAFNDSFVAKGFDAPTDFLQELEKGASFDLVICDLVMNSMNGLAFIAALRNRTKKIPILVLSGINSAPPIAEIERLGGNGFVHKSVENDVLLEAIEALAANKTYFSSGFGDAVIERAKPLQDLGDPLLYSASKIPKLGARQIEVLRLMAEGATNKDISVALCISENTVKTHLKQIFKELGVNKRTSCTRKAQTMGII